MISPTLFNELLDLKGSQIDSLEELAAAVPELFAIPAADLKRICGSLHKILRQAAEPTAVEANEHPEEKTRTVPKAKRPQPENSDAIHAQALEVAKSDPTQSPPPPGWAVNTCSCGAKFTVPEAKRLPSMCWSCLGQAGRKLRVKNIQAYLLSR